MTPLGVEALEFSDEGGALGAENVGRDLGDGTFGFYEDGALVGVGVAGLEDGVVSGGEGDLLGLDLQGEGPRFVTAAWVLHHHAGGEDEGPLLTGVDEDRESHRGRARRLAVQPVGVRVMWKSYLRGTKLP